jgi:prepilin-type N-terminal cleavage/methylation domain-containing protein
MLSASATVAAPGAPPRLPPTRERGRGFSLVELLVVIAIIATLAALLLPALGRAKEHALATKCLSNLRQIGVATQLYIQDHDSRYPTAPDFGTGGSGGWQGWRFGGGDPDPAAAARSGLEAADHRLLWPYTKSRDVYRCPADRGEDFSPSIQAFQNSYETCGSSYFYNIWPWSSDLDATVRVPLKDPVFGLAGKKESWLTSPSRYILFNEPPAMPYRDFGFWRYFFWHNSRGKATVLGPYSRNVTDRSISPALFADEHAVKEDFTEAIKASPAFPFEATPLWYWYEPAR